MVEPTNKSMLDFLDRTLKILNRKTFIHRLIYIGEHSFPERPGPDRLTTLQEAMQITVDDVNHDCWAEPITGVLLHYPNYFVHLIDGSENSLNNHLRSLLDNYGEKLGKMKLLVVYHHINQRFFDVWEARTGKPPTLLEKINPRSNIDETFRYIDICLTKMYTLANQLRVQDDYDDVKTIRKLQDYMIVNMPEYTLLEFLLNSHYIQDVSEYTAGYLKKPIADFWERQIWPIRTDNVPLDIFDADEDPVQDLYTKQIS